MSGMALGLFVCIQTSCNSHASKSPDSEKVLAQYNGIVLSKADISRHIPSNLNKTDSAAFVKNYVEQWLRGQAVMEEAKKKIPNLEEEVENELANIRMSLIQKNYGDWIANQVDTNISEQELKEYYDKNIEKFNSLTTLYQYFYVQAKGKDFRQIVSQIKSSNPDEILKLRKWCSEKATDYRLDSSFVEVEELNRISKGYYGNLARAKMNTVHTYSFEENQVHYSHFFKLLKVIRPNETLPLSACKARIRAYILNLRKNEWISKNENALLKKAQEEGKISFQ
jgi:hypothetical protein